MDPRLEVQLNRLLFWQRFLFFWAGMNFGTAIFSEQSRIVNLLAGTICIVVALLPFKKWITETK